MLGGGLSLMEQVASFDIEHMGHHTSTIEHEFWPLDEIICENSRFPCCLVWSPLPVVSWLAPFIGHLGICKEDGVILDFAGSSFVNVDNFAFGSVARYIQLNRKKCCLPQNLGGHSCKHGYWHTESGTAKTWDDALQSSMHDYENKTYNLFTCNSHSFAANCLNRLCYDGSMGWNMVNVAALVLFKGHWVNTMSILRSFFPFTIVVCFGIWFVGWSFLIGLFSLSFLLVVWFLLGSYLFKNLLEW